ncbi:MAG TPA: GNAT family N-acetyltransferase [Acidimicrobiales bacterium]|jgi:RimJ/RimL family protein N-acetyltransferase
MTIAVRRLGTDEWETLRVVRLAALLDAPYAFGSTHDEEVPLDEAAWRTRLVEQVWFVAFDADSPVGLASGGPLREPDPDVRSLRSMWVETQYRGSGLAAEIVRAVADWARGDGARRITLWATEDAARARAFYERQGFEPTGEVRTVDGRDHVAMSRYELAL